MKVSVVMATYNTGPRIEWTISQLERQTLPVDDFEIVVVDDGSTDDTLARLKGLQAVYPNLVVEQIPNSGWPGRPRNVGVGLARGEFVFFMDHDDTMFPEALERLHAFAVRAEADVVVPKEVVEGWVTPGWPTWRENVPRARIDADLLACLTPHKLYRAGFLREAGVRFPEGRIRLEDFDFNAQAYARTERVAIFSEYPCYTWIIRGDNSHKSGYNVDVYWSSFERSLRPIVEDMEPGPAQDAMLVRWYRSRVLERLNPQMLNYTDRWKGRLRGKFASVMPYFPERLDAQLTPADRCRSVLLRRDDWEGLATLAQLDAHARPVIEHLDVAWEDGALRVGCEGSLRTGDPQGLVFRPSGERVLRVLPPELGLEEDDLDVQPSLDKTRIDLIVRSREDLVDWNAETTWECGPRRNLGRATSRLAFRASATFDPRVAAFGRPLDNGVWDVIIRVTGLGWGPAVRVGTPDPVLLPACTDGRTALAYSTVKRTLAVDLGGTTRDLVAASSPSPESLEVAAGEDEVAVRCSLPGVHRPPEDYEPVEGCLTVGETRHDAWLVPDAQGVTLVSFPEIEPGEWPLRTRFGARDGSLGVTVARDEDGVVVRLTSTGSGSTEPAAPGTSPGEGGGAPDFSAGGQVPVGARAGWTAGYRRGRRLTRRAVRGLRRRVRRW